MTVRYKDSDEPPAPPVPSAADIKQGYRRCGDGFLPGFIDDPTHDGDTHGGGASYEYNGETGSRVYRRKLGSQ